MSEYIEREALLKDIEDSVVFTAKSGQPSLEIRGANKITARIMAAPAADVVEVVRCKDCQYWQDNNGGYPHEDCRWGKGETPDADDYCSFGAKMDEKVQSLANKKYPRCSKCVYEMGCSRTYDNEGTCPKYKRDAPDGGYYG